MVDHRQPIPRPIRQNRIVRAGFVRTPYDEPLTPGLRRKDNANPIGFTARIISHDENDE